ncbi:phosphoenolpyruvate carboxykinase (ATP) [Natrarchaeobaculum sulfurireducens]|uniref:phosphoenolpyruvate carboxykinase (ATP) n=1 Tax=Natrarchaeobaculum sulfurireducens TaxID=2044521 RepID=A0A346PQP3_9EURY|nr:phosphoenolpyruvate carboxykinase (ATP) [Natrarchaeobaculum sulfurireducens]AXR78173.1 Phosphoenolpyruvate carboxykinase [Natrarchaeobaculum sulfurireducens]AXR81838.1 Phosphoenolpyruvate carboxykinase (ATP) [Natrarchaeobaculum sulfurireducens]
MSETGTKARPLAEQLPDPSTASNVRYNPSLEELRELAAHEETTTEFGSPSYVSEFRSRSSDRTKNTVDHDFSDEDYDLVDEAIELAGDGEMLCVDRLMGRHEEATFCCRLFVPTEHARIALAWANLFEPTDGREPDLYTVQLPDYDETAIRVLPDEGVTAVLGSDYLGEAKKSFLRLFMYRLKERGGLGLHAGSKRVRVRDDDGDLQTVGQVFMGLSATGKSTLTSHGCWLEGAEDATMLQDDVCAVLPDGSVPGSEGKGLFIKTIGLDEDEQPALYRAATDESAILENVAVDDDGSVDFDEDRYTSNSRAIVQRSELESADEEIDLEQVDQVFFITRNPLMPPVSKLTDEQAAVAFMLGESIETSAGDPSRAGESIRVVGTNPFIIGSEGQEGNLFYDLVGELDVDCYVLNTGYLGEESVDIGVTESVTILTETARGTIEWTDDEQTGLTIPESIPELEIEEFYVPDHVDDYEEAVAALRAERREYLEQFDDLLEEIKDAVY